MHNGSEDVLVKSNTALPSLKIEPSPVCNGDEKPHPLKKCNVKNHLSQSDSDRPMLLLHICLAPEPCGGQRPTDEKRCSEKAGDKNIFPN